MAISRKHDSTDQDVAFFGKYFVAFGRKKKVKQEPVPHRHHDQDVTFLEDVFLPLAEKRVMQEWSCCLKWRKKMLIRNVQVTHIFYPHSFI